MKHLLGIEHISKEDFEELLKDAEQFAEVTERDLKKVPTLRGKTVINLFFEPSTRTRTSFELAGKRMSADVINISASASSTKKGETLIDTARTLEAMAPDVLVVRHADSGVPHMLARFLRDTAIVNAGDGMHEHPTQALLDMLTLRRALEREGRDYNNLTVAILGDVRHSRVARSLIYSHLLLGNSVRLIGPRTLVPDEFADSACFGESISVHHDLSGLKGVDVVTVLRLQLERQNQLFIPTTEEYCNEYCLTSARYNALCPDAIVMHPGPANRGIEISSDVLDSNISQVQVQVRLGLAVRMAVLFRLAFRKGEDDANSRRQAA